MDLGLNGRTAVVTGGSKGLGFATVQVLIDAGARVAFCARNAAEIKEAEEALGGGARGYVVDVTDAEQVERFISEAAADFGGIDVLVNNAGGAHPGTGETITDDAFQADFNIKVLSWQRTIKAALPHLRKSDQHRIRVRALPLPRVLLHLRAPRRRSEPDQSVGGGTRARQHPGQRRKHRRY